MNLKSIGNELRHIGQEFKQGWKDEMNIVKKSAKQAFEDTYGLSAAIGTGYGINEARVSGKPISGAVKGAIKGSAVEFLVRFTINLVDNQLKYNHGVKK
ncbi:hypothetical protein [Geobacillus thermocatenulatus]|uniref:Uncharacterized protein n=2 Tax=Geobacillus TaxID=129337 RepID=A0A226Q3V5_9BACL|nr:hypothetical protein [Geobacillus thermocatenulatus]ASS99755.1 hypothetical protein GT3921_12415 [Geobacillus thermocatenulatus]KLR72773.1 hypothetical protein ABH20_14625 [Geobacillus sp. T6]OXB87041.1 hypothetical protein B9L19_16550 [Geobacillus thermocatenulatus]